MMMLMPVAAAAATARAQLMTALFFRDASPKFLFFKRVWVGHLFATLLRI